MHSPITFGKILVDELPNALSRILPPEAYTEIKGTRKKGMTDTKPHFLRQRLTEIFGTAGYGWWFEVEDMTSEFDSGAVETPASKVTTSEATWSVDLDGKTTWVPQTKTVVEIPATAVGKENNNPWTSTCRIKFYFRYKTQDTDGKELVVTSEPVVGVGGINMDRKDFSERGAVTNALGDALKMMGWQRGLWEGKFNHKTAGEAYAKQQAAIAKWKEESRHVPGEPIETE